MTAVPPVRPWMASRLPSWLVDKVPRDHRETDAAFRRRRKVVAGVSVAGAGLLGVSLSTEPDSPQFYALTMSVAGTWLVGGLSSGPLHLGWMQADDSTLRRPVLAPIAAGVGAFGLFYGAALVARHVTVLNEAITSVLQYARQGSDPLVLATTLANGVGEEVFFRGALFAAVGCQAPGGRLDGGLHARNDSDPQSCAGAGLRRDGCTVRTAAPCLRRHPGAGPHPPDVVDTDAALPAAAVP